MSTSLTGNDTLIINGFNLIDLADGDNSTLTHPNELMTVKTGKNGNILYAYNGSGNQGDLTVRLVRGSASDRFLNSLMKQMKLDPALFTLMRGTFIKRTGNGFGLITNDTYVLVGGVFSKQVDAKSNAEGDTEQSVSVYTIKWGAVLRAIV